MAEYTPNEVQSLIQDEVERSLEGMLREGARRMLQSALTMEAESYLEQCKGERDEKGHRRVVRNGHHRERALVTGVGKISIRQPRVDDRRAGQTAEIAARTG